MVIFEIFISVIIVSLISFIGAIGLLLKEKLLKKLLPFMISFAAGGLFGAAFLDLIPEAIELLPVSRAMLSVVAGIVAFFIFEKFLYWYHCHYKKTCNIHNAKKKTLPSLNLMGDFIHNMIDGMIIAASYLTDIRLGMVTTVAVVFHEIPQEIGDVGILLYSGMSKWRVLFYNFLTALSAILGAVIVVVLADSFTEYIAYLIPFAAGGFIYIAGSDLIPELHQETGTKKSLFQLFFIMLGISIIYVLGRFL